MMDWLAGDVGLLSHRLGIKLEFVTAQSQKKVSLKRHRNFQLVTVVRYLN